MDRAFRRCLTILLVFSILLIQLPSSSGRAIAAPSSTALATAGHAYAAPAAAYQATGLTERVSVSTIGEQGIYDSRNPSTSADGRFVAFHSWAYNLVTGDTNGAIDVFVHDHLTGVTERVSVSSSEIEANAVSWFPSISADGRYVAFQSYADNLVGGDTNGAWDIFVRDRQLGITERVSVASGGAQANEDSYMPSISDDGRFVAFASVASNLVAEDTNSMQDVFIHDRQTGSTQRVSVSSIGTQGNNSSTEPSISHDGRYVAFQSYATNLVSGDTNGVYDIFVRDRQLGITERVSVASGGAQANGESRVPSISDDGRFVAFASFATNLVSGDTNGVMDIFVYDRQTGANERITISSGGEQGDGTSWASTISADGRFVAFESEASNLVSGDTNDQSDIFVRERQTGVTERVSVSSGSTQGNGGSYNPSISADGRFVAFQSLATNLVSGGTNGADQIFAHDRQTGENELVSISSSGIQGNGPSFMTPSISANGRFVAFASEATNLISEDTNGVGDIFVRDREIGITERVSVSSGGIEGNDWSMNPSISADGRFVAFESWATNLVGTDTNGYLDIFVHDRETGITERVSVSSGDIQGNGMSEWPSISADGRFVAFVSGATNLVGGDTNGIHDLFVHDRQTGITERVSVSSGGIQANNASWASSISADGRFVAFMSEASNLVGGDTNGWPDIFVRDRELGTTERVSVSSSGEQGNAMSNVPSISADGRFVAFESEASNLVSGDTNGVKDIFIHDRQTGRNERSSISSGGEQGNQRSDYPAISADGRFVAFYSDATNLVSEDTNGQTDIFAHDRQSGVTELVSVSSSGEQGNTLSNNPSISANGRFVAFRSNASNLVNADMNGYSDIFVRDRCPDGLCEEAYLISGRVVDPAGAGLADVSLTVLRLDGSVATSGQTRSDGEYRISGLPAGVYRLIPNKISYTFMPDTLTVQLERVRTGQNFVGSFNYCGVAGRYSACPLPFVNPFLDLPVDYADFTDAAMGYQDPAPGGRVMSWFDHDRADNTLTRIWNGQASPAMDAAACEPRSACYEGHEGIDFNRLTLPVKAAAGGRVIQTVSGCPTGSPGDSCGDYLGNQVWIDHGNGYASLYGHLAPGSVQAREGDLVSQGQVIGTIGQTGSSPGEHLHFMLLFDANGDGTWDRYQEMVDPYGWDPLDDDGDRWSVPSVYLWEHPLYAFTYIDAEGGICFGPNEGKSASLPPGATGSNLLCGLGETPVPAQPGDSPLRIVSSFYLRSWMPLFPSASGDLAMEAAAQAGPYTLNIAYAPEAVSHLDTSSLRIYYWDRGGEIWTSLPTSLHSGPRARADTELSGDFTLQAPLVCPADTAEPYNDAPALALAYPQTTLPQVAHHLFDIAGDEDWTAFTAKAGRTYSIRTQALASGVDTVLQVYAADGVTELGKDDNGGGGKASHLIWTAPESGVYHVRVSQAAGSAYGCNSGYDLRIAEPGGEQLFLPLLAR